MNAPNPIRYLARIGAGVCFAFVTASVVAAVEQDLDDANTPAINAAEEATVDEAATESAFPGEEIADSKEEDGGKILSPRMRTHNRFLLLYDGKRYEEASAVGQEVVRLTREEFGQKHINVVSPLVNLAIAQSKSGDLTSAEANYLESITIIEDEEGALSPRLINALSGLGSTYNKAGLYEKGVSSLERALLINHVNEGLYNFEQFKIHDGLTDSFVGLNELDDATFYQKTQVDVHERKLGAGDPQVANALYKLAEWYARINDTEQAMLSYRKADRLLRKSGGDQSATRVEALQGIASVYERQGLPSSTASTLKKALGIIDAQPEVDYVERAKILVTLGDVYARQGKFESSELNYSVAWDNLSQDESYEEQRDYYFREPVRVLGGRFSTIEYSSRGKSESSLKDGYVVISYSITENGRVRDLEVIESEPAGLMDRSILATYKRSIYRPRRADEGAVASTDRISRHDFRYAESQAEVQDASDDDEGSKKRGRDDERLEYPGQVIDE